MWQLLIGHISSFLYAGRGKRRGCVKMKGKWISKLLENKKVVRTGCGLMAAVVLMSGGLYVYQQQNTYVPELSVFVDGEETMIADEEVPLASAPKVKKTTKTKKTVKNVKLKKASAKTYTKKLPTKKSKKTTTKNSSTQTVKTVVETTTSTTEKYTKKKKVKKVTTTVKTVTTTTTTQKEQAAAKTNTATKAATTGTTTTAAAAKTAAKEVVKKSLDVNVAAVLANANVRNAYTTLGFQVSVDSTVNYSGKFDAKNRMITLKEESDDIYHELGHFLTFMAGINIKSGGEGYKVYTAEKSLYTGSNKAYVTQDADEYLAECYRDYILNPAALQATRPQSYALIEKAISKVTDSQVSLYKKVYAAYWK